MIHPLHPLVEKSRNLYGHFLVNSHYRISHGKAVFVRGKFSLETGIFRLVRCCTRSLSPQHVTEMAYQPIKSQTLSRMA